jgi:Na+-translocating ferredoxin:NAD+ oxidoreductase subunit B
VRVFGVMAKALRLRYDFTVGKGVVAAAAADAPQQYDHRSSTMAKAASRIVEVNNGLIGPGEPRKRNVRIRKISDYPNSSKAHLDTAKKLSNPLIMGPPICDEFIAFIEHCFTEDEARVVSHLGMVKKSAPDIAKSTGMPLDQVEEILKRLTTEKLTITKSGGTGSEKYSLMPVFPGIFEMVLIGQDPAALSEWHRRFAELFEDLFITGYWLDSQSDGSPGFVRYLPVEESVAGNSMVLPIDKMEPWLDPYKDFAVGHCQCRTTAIVEGKGCGKPTLNCLVVGEMAVTGVRDGWLVKRVTKADALEIKREAEAHGMVNWMFNVESAKNQSSCSCCGCCCHNFRQISEFSAPGAIVPPHFLPVVDATKCNYCGKCALACPMAALVIDTKAKTREHLLKRCIGCGLCVLACDKTKASSMELVGEVHEPAKSMGRLTASMMPGMVKTSLRTFWERRKA